ncbi:hypothetical protein D3C85_878660 [compost metagenome]
MMMPQSTPVAVGEYRDRRHGGDYQHVVQRYLVFALARGSGEALLRHHEHHPDQRYQPTTQREKLSIFT